MDINGTLTVTEQADVDMARDLREAQELLAQGLYLLEGVLYKQESPQAITDVVGPLRKLMAFHRDSFSLPAWLREAEQKAQGVL